MSEKDPPKKKSFWSRYGNPPKLTGKTWAIMIGMVGLFVLVWSMWILANP